jgi:uncharacterized membrane protein
MAETPTATPTGGLGKSSTGMDANLAALFSYVLGVITGIIFFVIEKESKFVKFHAMQSICFSAGLFIVGMVLAFIPVIGWIAGILLQLASLVFWIICMIKAYQGVWYKLPVVGDIAAKQVGGI